MSDRNTEARQEYRREIAFLEERLRTVEREIRRRCASMMERYPEVRESVQGECRRPFGEEEPIEGLLLAADAALLRFKRERHLLEWLREMVARFPLSRLLWEGPALLTARCECLEREADSRAPYPEEYWEIRHSAETLRFLWRLWSEWEPTENLEAVVAERPRVDSHPNGETDG